MTTSSSCQDISLCVLFLVAFYPTVDSEEKQEIWEGARKMTRKGTQPALLQFPGPNIIQEISILYVARLENCQILFQLIFKSKSSGGSGPSPNPYFPFCFTFYSHSNVKLILSDHIGLSTSIVCALAEQGGRESLKKNPFTLEVRRSWILTNATLMRSASGEGGCVAQSADGGADMLIVPLLCFGWLEATRKKCLKL